MRVRRDSGKVRKRRGEKLGARGGEGDGGNVGRVK